MTRGYNELVGLQATFSMVVPRYSLTYHYRWGANGKKARTGTLRGYDMHRHIPATEILRKLGDAYAPAILSIWHRITRASYEQYLQFEVNATPEEMKLPGEWHIWAEW